MRAAPRDAGSRSARRSATGTWPASAGGTSTYDFAELRDEVIYQFGALDAFCRLFRRPGSATSSRTARSTTRPATDECQAAAVVAAVSGYDPALPVLCLPGSTLAQLAVGAGLPVVAEGFADRAYLPDGALVPRGTARAR